MLTSAPSVTDLARMQDQIEFADVSAYPIDRVPGSTGAELTTREAQAVAMLWTARTRLADAVAKLRTTIDEIVARFADNPSDRIQIVALAILPLIIRNANYRPYAGVTPSSAIRVRGPQCGLPDREMSWSGNPREVLTFIRECCRRQQRGLNRPS